MTNDSGIKAVEFKCLILPKEVEGKIGSILLPDEAKDKEKFATMEGTLVDASHLAFTYATEAEWDGQKPAPGDRVLFVKYAGIRVKGPKDGREYLLINDKDVVAVIKD